MDLSVEFKGYVPQCVRVTVSDAEAPREHTSSETLTKDKLASSDPNDDRTVRIAVYREESWSQKLLIEVSSFKDTCGGALVETRKLGPVTLPEKGAVPRMLQLLALDSDKDGYIAKSADPDIQQDDDCDDSKDYIYRGAQRTCGTVPDPIGDYDCDDVPECAQQPNGQACQAGTMCKSGFCVAGFCCESACDTPPDTCRGAPTCGGGTCKYPIAEGKACNDGNKCTTVDTCNNQGQCVGASPVVCPPRSETCVSSAGTCVPSDGGCHYAPFDAGTACDDNNGCSSGEKCNGAGSCGSGTLKVCNTPGTGQPCLASVGSCLPADGGCVYPTVDAGTACDDGTACTHTDQCSGTSCSGTAYTCTPNACQQQVPACAGDGGCVFTADNTKNGSSCDLGASQTGFCMSGECSSFPYVPSNFDPDVLTPAQISNLPIVNLTCDATFNSTTGSWSMVGGCSAPVVPTRVLSPVGAPQVLVLSMKQLDIASGKSLKLVGDKPVILAVYGNATFTGKLLANASKQAPGTGGNSTQCGTRAGNDGAVKSGEFPGSGGGGGGHAFAGGNGGKGATAPEAPVSEGGTASTTALVPLVGGCAGGRGGQLTATAGLGGAGGGAVQVSVAGTLQVKDQVSVSGGGGKGGTAVIADAAGGGGGGSGGGLLLEANDLDLQANARLTANGGGGGEGGDLGTTPENGLDGADGSLLDNTHAAGGNSGGGAAGGNGGRGATANNVGIGGDGNANEAGGGGGGAVGRIHVYGKKSCALNSSVISPAATRGGICP
ncbi:hypothetical protein [Archangium sp.]|uniref:hypothetical protein n=1 Tax=Archangium sp. TaxID=1872627 RepID=UPI00286B818E|nr:hypothetical protein [Archangium sp.]